MLSVLLRWVAAPRSAKAKLWLRGGEFAGTNGAKGRRRTAMAPEPVSSAPAPRAAEGKPREEGLAPQIWVAGLIGIIVILLIVFSIVL